MAEPSPRLKRVLEKVRPKTFFEDLAEYGYLMQYIGEFLNDKWEEDEGFRIKIFNILIEHSKYPVNEVNEYYLWHLSNVLKQFQKRLGDA